MTTDENYSNVTTDENCSNVGIDSKSDEGFEVDEGALQDAYENMYAVAESV